jgi:hypothetical protein
MYRQGYARVVQEWRFFRGHWGSRWMSRNVSMCYSLLLEVGTGPRTTGPLDAFAAARTGQGEAHYSALTACAFRPQPAAMRVDDRATDR